jgi:hypothetical protein
MRGKAPGRRLAAGWGGGANERRGEIAPAPAPEDYAAGRFGIRPGTATRRLAAKRR